MQINRNPYNYINPIRGGKTTEQFVRQYSEYSNFTKGTLKLIRSDAPNNLSKDEIQWLLQNDITTIIDLRDGDEVKRKPCPLLQNSEFTYFHIPVSGGNIIPKSSDMVSLVYLNLKKMLKDYVACHPEVDIEVITPKKRYIEEFLDNLRL